MPLSFNPKEKRNMLPSFMAFIFLCMAIVNGVFSGGFSMGFIESFAFLIGTCIGIGLLYFIMSSFSNLIAISLEKLKGGNEKRVQDMRV